MAVVPIRKRVPKAALAIDPAVSTGGFAVVPIEQGDDDEDDCSEAEAIEAATGGGGVSDAFEELRDGFLPPLKKVPIRGAVPPKTRKTRATAPKAKAKGPATPKAPKSRIESISYSRYGSTATTTDQLAVWVPDMIDRGWHFSVPLSRFLANIAGRFTASTVPLLSGDNLATPHAVYDIDDDEDDESYGVTRAGGNVRVALYNSKGVFMQTANDIMAFMKAKPWLGQTLMLLPVEDTDPLVHCLRMGYGDYHSDYLITPGKPVAIEEKPVVLDEGGTTRRGLKRKKPPVTTQLLLDYTGIVVTEQEFHERCRGDNPFVATISNAIFDSKVKPRELAVAGRHMTIDETGEENAFILVDYPTEAMTLEQALDLYPPIPRAELLESWVTTLNKDLIEQLKNARKTMVTAETEYLKHTKRVNGLGRQLNLLQADGKARLEQMLEGIDGIAGIETVTMNPRGITMITEDVWWEGNVNDPLMKLYSFKESNRWQRRYLGKYEIRFDPVEITIKVRNIWMANTSVPAMATKTGPTECCMGSYVAPMREALNEGSWDTLILLTLDFLRDIHQHDSSARDEFGELMKARPDKGVASNTFTILS